ncbi:TRAP transporter, 4TM/12TM fusion protein [Propionivibrio dicarboxylicus]|uniref:TRAP transporter, 4TM/12TM fusion protein n=1 Tax=Propionivibrio dicarboxylicus TaxID=83767 RepID=A0A1G8A6T5_9RHOO|nr:TRAP transporter, 4TM/12TM fusion protein [Propionivibrio dicarboxylicus]
MVGPSFIRVVVPDGGRAVSEKEVDKPEMTDEEIRQMVAESDTGGRRPSGVVAKIIMGVALAWSLFQLWIASPLPFSLGFFVLNDTESRAIHLAVAMFLGYMLFPPLKTSPRAWIPVQDWVIGLLGAFCAAYLYIFYVQLAGRPGQPTTLDLVVAAGGLVFLLEVTRRVVGLPMAIMAILFIGYIFLGPYMPDMIAHKGASFSKAMSHLWLSTEGVFGVALGVSSGFVFLYVLFGALLDTGGAGNYFIKSALSLLGHMRGGPAKAAVVSSGLTGLISGSSIANVVTVGTFTIPLMKRVGYKPHVAGAVETAASVDGQIMPPVMGAAAFLMVEYVGIPYTQIIKHAALPAIMSYIALFYIVHLEACKANLKGIPREVVPPLMNRLVNFVMTISGVVILANIVYFGLGWIKNLAGPASVYIIAVLMLIAYIALLRYEARYPELHMEDPNSPILTLPQPGPTLKSGLHFLLPVAALIWNLMVEELSPALSAFWATVFLMFILVTQRPLSAFFRGREDIRAQADQGFADLKIGLTAGARNMIGVAIATSTAGIIVGTVTLTGIGLVLAEVVELISAGNLLLMLVMVAVASLILGMGVPTTANYIIVSSLMAPVVVELGAQSGLIVPLIAIHMFVFYFGIMADVTPPVGLAAYAAAGIAKTDPLLTGFTAFWYSIRTSVLPFMFIYNTQLLLIGINSVPEFIIVVVFAVIASLVFVAASQHWFLTRNTWPETIVLLLIAFSLFRPNFWMDMVYPPYSRVAATDLMQLIEKSPANESLRVWVEGEDINGKPVKKGMLLPLGEPGPATKRLDGFGLRLLPQGEQVDVLLVKFRSKAEKAGFQQGQKIIAMEVPNPRPAPEWMILPALAVLSVIVVLQRRRIAKGAPS